MRGLKIKIALVCAILLLLSMLLTDFVVIRALQRNLVVHEIERFDRLLTAAQTKLAEDPQHSTRFPQITPRQLHSLTVAAGTLCAAIAYPDHRSFPAVSAGCPIATGAQAQANSALRTGKRQVSYHGQTWNVFWKQPLYVLVAAPIKIKVASDASAELQNGSRVGPNIRVALSAVIDLGGVYQVLRRSQRLFSIYLVINLAVLASILVAYISRSVFRPLIRLTRQAETFQRDYASREDFMFAADTAGSEFQQVSLALNRMMSRIGDDRNKLRSAYDDLAQTHLELQRIQDEIIQTEKLATAGRLSAGIAHEIGNPIGIVMGYLDLLQQSDITAEDRRDYLQRAVSEIDRIDTIIRQLLDLSRPTNAGAQSVDTHSLLRDLQKMAAVQPAMANLKIELAANAARQRISADPGQVRQVFLNLMLNAADATATADDAQLRISTSVSSVIKNQPANRKPMLQITFSDNGPGIAEIDLGNIFDPFFTTKDTGQGTGLGLSVCYMLIKNWGGLITAKNNDDKGAVVTVGLPLSDDQQTD